MRTLILFRHAKSSWDDASLDDFDRPLAERGLRAAPAMALWLRQSELVPDFALVSAAKRTIQTWEAVAPVMEAPIPHRVEPNLYLAAPSAIVDLIHAVDAGVRRLLVVGHNPGTEEVAARLARDDGRKANRRMRKKFPTAAVAVIEFDVTRWLDVSAGTGTLRAFKRPKDL